MIVAHRKHRLNYSDAYVTDEDFVSLLTFSGYTAQESQSPVGRFRWLLRRVFIRSDEIRTISNRWIVLLIHCPVILWVDQFNQLLTSAPFVENS